MSRGGSVEHVRFVLLLLPIAAVVAFGLLLHRIVNLRKLAPLAEVLDGRSFDARGVLSVSLEGHFNGSEAAFRIVPQGKHRPAQFRLDLACSSSKNLRIDLEDAASRMKKELRILRETEVQDPALDDSDGRLATAKTPFRRRDLDPSAVRDALERLQELVRTIPG